MIPEGWKLYKLGEIAKIIGGGTPATAMDKYWDGTIPWLTPRDLTNYQFKNIYRGERSITELGLRNSSARLLPKGTVLLTSRAPIGYLAIAENPICTNQGFKSLIADETKVNNLFLYYLLKQNIEQIKSQGTGTTFAEVSGSTLKEIEFAFPESLSVQSHIASILSSLDDKIELNLQMNKTLEAIAQAIFKEWFVDFHFPGFDGKLIDGLPKGWRKTMLGELCKKITKGTTPTTLKKDYVNKGINFIKVESIDEYGSFLTYKFAFIDQETNQLLKRSIVEENDILFTIAGTLGRVAKVDKSILPANINQAVAIIRFDDPKYINYIYSLLKTERFKNSIQSKAVHAVQANISLGVISDSEVIIPDNKTLHDFNLITNSILNKIVTNTYEVRTLTSIRDSLLPKLMTGKIRVNG